MRNRYSLYEEKNAADFTHRQICQRLEGILDQISEDDIEFLYHGTYNVFLIKEQFIFRFPDKNLSNAACWRLILREVKVLKELGGKLTFRIPSPLFISENPSTPFIGYEKIEGISLSRCFASFGLEERQNLAYQIGSFLSDLHSDKIYTLFKKMEIEGEETGRRIRKREFDYYMKIKRVYPLLTSEEVDWIERISTEYFDEENFSFHPVVIHGDFDTSNILVDPMNIRITGVIDFEECGYGDPAYDLTFYDEGNTFRNAILKKYLGEADARLSVRTKYYSCKQPFVYLLTGIELGKERMIDYARNLLKERKKRFGV